MMLYTTESMTGTIRIKMDLYTDIIHFADSRTGLMDSQTELEIATNNKSRHYPTFQHWRHHYLATAAGSL